MGPVEGGPPADERGENEPSARLTAVRERILTGHRGTLAATLDAADAVATSGALSDGRALRRRLRARLDDRGLLAAYPVVLRTAVDAAGLALAADPVAAPPYVVVTSRGPVLRGSTGDGRLVVAVRAFDVRSSDPDPDPDPDSDSDPDSDQHTGRRYVRTSSSSDAALVVTFR